MERTSARRGVGERGARRAIDGLAEGRAKRTEGKERGSRAKVEQPRQHRGANIEDKHREQTESRPRGSNRTEEKRPAHIEGKR